jgi:uncharacterized membrane protein
MDGVAYSVLQRALIAVNGADSPFSKALATDVKGNLSLVLYLIAIATGFFTTIVPDIILIVVAVMWIIPDRRFEPLIKVSP